jgi:hypothetical protein
MVVLWLARTSDELAPPICEQNTRSHLYVVWRLTLEEIQ